MAKLVRQVVCLNDQLARTPDRTEKPQCFSFEDFEIAENRDKFRSAAAKVSIERDGIADIRLAEVENLMHEEDYLGAYGLAVVRTVPPPAPRTSARANATKKVTRVPISVYHAQNTFSL